MGGGGAPKTAFPMMAPLNVVGLQLLSSLTIGRGLLGIVIQQTLESTELGNAGVVGFGKYLDGYILRRALLDPSKAHLALHPAS